MAKQIIPTSYDRQIVLLLPLIFLALFLLLFYANTGWVFQVSMALIFLVAIASSLSLIPFQITKDEKALVLKRIAGTIILKIEDIEKIEVVEFSDFRRKIGIHGLFGYYGYNDLAGLGQVKLMAKAKKELILIQSAKHEPIVVSVDDVVGLEIFS